ncbi:hypothetical protein TNIN_412241 [Trichonephila inaurata madagascariensis]|uniref:Uncharacterized protein n=1 Tax=Trichonephila inaurata madagascariensis TaxID=2747483 RepID=A0A8X7CHE1_9ARAC|nr:hypothetical protein TNIN_412241 [Trichonephila inaurata madagascariensis]
MVSGLCAPELIPSPDTTVGVVSLSAWLLRVPRNYKRSVFGPRQGQIDMVRWPRVTLGLLKIVNPKSREGGSIELVYSYLSIPLNKTGQSKLKSTGSVSRVDCKHVVVRCFGLHLQFLKGF